MDAISELALFGAIADAGGRYGGRADTAILTCCRKPPPCRPGIQAWRAAC
jgi:hypothetical protein